MRGPASSLFRAVEADSSTAVGRGASCVRRAWPGRAAPAVGRFDKCAQQLLHPTVGLRAKMGGIAERLGII